MRLRKLLVAVVFCVAVAGFARDGFGGDLTDKAIGIWGYQKHDSTFNRDEYYFLEIKKVDVVSDASGQELFAVACDRFDHVTFYSNCALWEKDGRVIVYASSRAA